MDGRGTRFGMVIPENGFDASIGRAEQGESQTAVRQKR